LINTDSGVILRFLVAEGIADNKFSLIFFNTFIVKRQQTLSMLIREHSLFSDEDIDTVNALVDIIFGAMWYRLIFEHRPLDEKLAVFLTDLVRKSSLK
jgi:hypothetical protein